MDGSDVKTRETYLSEGFGGGDIWIFWNLAWDDEQAWHRYFDTPWLQEYGYV